MYCVSSFLCFISSLLLCLLLFTQETASHPHVFIVTRYTLVFDGKGLSGIRVNWQFDEYFSTMISGDYDSDNNGVIDPNENQQIEKRLFRIYKISVISPLLRSIKNHLRTK